MSEIANGTTEKYSFNISLSVLNHLGRNLYRSFSTVLGEAISNSWDADAKKVYITIDRENKCFSIKDDGNGMDSDAFQNKFLRVGYSKRVGGASTSSSGRPFIGRKGIGKLALLSCSEKVHVISKKEGDNVVGGIINNPVLDSAISGDVEEYSLEDISTSKYKNKLDDQSKGTFLFFENLKDGIKNTPEYLRTIIAMYFRFSTIDTEFHIFVDEKEVTVDDLQSLVNNTEFLWVINGLTTDPLLDKIKEKIKLPAREMQLSIQEQTEQESSAGSEQVATINGFISSVDVPSNMAIRTTGERVSIDLFVNGRLREKDILKHITTNRITESYLYGQINYNSLDDGEDPFTSSRESVKEDNEKFKTFLDVLKEQVILPIIDQWDSMRDERGKDGDSENTRIPKKQRKAKELFNITAEEYTGDVTLEDPLHDNIENWLKSLREEAQFNYPSYSECFLSENLTRKFILHKNFLPLSEEKQRKVDDFKNKETAHKIACGMNIDIRQYSNDLNYLDLTELSHVAEPGNGGNLASLQSKSKEFRPIRNAVMHTALLTNDAKTKLTSIFNDVKARLRYLLKVG